jgi:hypothetical protein
MACKLGSINWRDAGKAVAGVIIGTGAALLLLTVWRLYS